MNHPLEPMVAATPQVGVSRPHESAHLHVGGQATYTDDIPEVEGTLHAAVGLSPVAMAAGIASLVALWTYRRGDALTAGPVPRS